MNRDYRNLEYPCGSRSRTMLLMTDPASQTILRDLGPVRASVGILFFGGSFDPPHIGHVKLPEAVLATLGADLDRVVYVPAARSPHKESAPTGGQHRLRMLELAIRSASNARIWTDEIERAGVDPASPSYWSVTWASARSQRPDAPDRFLIGADQALSMHRWHRYRSFWRDAVVMLRDDHDAPSMLIDSLRSIGVWDETDLEHWERRIVQVPLIDASSTHIRSCLADPQRRENPIAGLDDRVQDYILDHGLYRG